MSAGKEVGFGFRMKSFLDMPIIILSADEWRLEPSLKVVPIGMSVRWEGSPAATAKEDE